MVVDGPIEKVLAPLIVMLPPTVAPLRMRLPEVSAMLPDAPPPTKTQLCVPETVKLPENVPL